MCGHVGMAGALEHSDENVIKRLLMFDYFRGQDSTGLAVINKVGKEGKIAKFPSHPIDFFETGAFKSLPSFSLSSVAIGHNRAATRGKVTRFNAHPYEFGHIIGAHNGTLDISSFKALNEKVGEDFDVDSMSIFANIEKFGIEETVPLLQGAWALVWVDLEKNTLNFLRNKQRPLWYAWSENCKKFIWGSTHEIIRAGLSIVPDGKEPLKVWSNEGGHGYFSFQVDKLYSIPVKDLVENALTPIKFDNLPTLQGKEPAPVVPYNAGGSFSNFPSTGTNGGGTNSTTTYLSGNNKPARVLTLYAQSGTHPLANLLSEEQFKQFALGGCNFCGTPVKWGDTGITIFEEEEEVLCSKCSTEAEGHVRYYTSPENLAALSLIY